MNKKGPAKKKPYDQPSASRTTRSASKSKSNAKNSSEEVVDELIDSQSNIGSVNETPQSSGPSWTDFNLLKKSVDEMHALLKSVNVASSLSKAVDNDKVTEIDKNDGFTVDNHIQVTVDKPREADVPMIVNFGDKDDNNKTGHDIGSHANIQSSVNRFLDSLANNPSNSGEMIYREPGRPIDLKVTEKQKQKIWSNQFIELATLLDPHVHAEVELTIISGPGEPIQFGPAKKGKSITNLGQWCSAFEIYISVYCQKDPSAVTSLLTYMNTIKTLAHKDGDYQTYDREFRMMRETMNLPWDLVHNGLWLECRDIVVRNKQKKFINGNNDSFRGKSSNNKSSQGKHPFGYCFRYHSFGKCGRASCLYKHACYECKDEKHSILKCPKTTKKGPENNDKQ